jgi:hypothetical protein
MQTKLPEIEIPGPEGWKITPDAPPNAIAMGTRKGFEIEPVDTLIIDYVTVEKYRGQLIDAVYPAQVERVHVTYWWDEEKQNWRASAPNIRVRLLNPTTLEPYSYRNPKGGTVDIRDLHFSDDLDEIPSSREKITQSVLAATKPKTKITIQVHEELLDD